jgi:cytochrome d ubiquinol oxidase subunit II
MADGAYAGGAFDWATPFVALCALGVLSGYALLGAAWLVLKTEGAIATRARRQAKSLLLVVLAFMAAVSLWTPLAFERIAERWFAMPNILFLWPVPFATAFAAFIGWRALDRGYELTPFWLRSRSSAWLSRARDLGVPLSGAAQPDHLGGSSPATQVFMLVGTLVLLPIILGYVAFVYWIFRGKVRADDGYH